MSSFTTEIQKLPLRGIQGIFYLRSEIFPELLETLHLLFSIVKLGSFMVTVYIMVKE